MGRYCPSQESPLTPPTRVGPDRRVDQSPEDPRTRHWTRSGYVPRRGSGRKKGVSVGSTTQGRRPVVGKGTRGTTICKSRVFPPPSRSVLFPHTLVPPTRSLSPAVSPFFPNAPVVKTYPHTYTPKVRHLLFYISYSPSVIPGSARHRPNWECGTVYTDDGKCLLRESLLHTYTHTHARTCTTPPLSPTHVRLSPTHVHTHVRTYVHNPTPLSHTRTHGRTHVYTVPPPK